MTPAASIEPRIEHVVVLMLENRSFDHMLGFLPHPDPTFIGLQAGGYHNVAADGSIFPATNDGEPGDAAPDHSHAGVLEQISGYGDVATNGGFIRSYASTPGNAAAGPRVMRCLDSITRLPVLARLATEFAVCDSWFSSVPGETWPNRNFAHAATSDGAADIELGFYYEPTIFERLAAAGASWRIYHDGLAQAWCFRNLWRQRTSWLDRLLGRQRTIQNWFLMPALEAHVRANDLPSYAFIEPSHLRMPGETGETNSQHPDNNRTNAADFYAGERLIGSVYESLRRNPELFAKTLLIVTYDEHGGFYDHVPPPAAVPPGGRVLRSWSRRVGRTMREWLARAQGRPLPSRAPFAFDRLGVRVPALLISPWIKPGTVIHTQLEHASIPATLRALFMPASSALTARDGSANTFHDVVRTHAAATPRGMPRAVSDAAGGGAPARPDGLSDVSGTTITMAPRSEAAGPKSSLDDQLVELGKRVHDELAREKPSAAAAPETLVGVWQKRLRMPTDR